MWQDYVLSFSMWVFAASLLPTIFHREHKPSFATAILTAAMMCIIVLTYASLGLTGSAIGGSALTVLWWVLVVQRYRINRRQGIPLISLPRVPHWAIVAWNDIRGTS